MNSIPLVDLKIQYKYIKKEIDSKIKSILENASFIGGNEVSNFSNNLTKLLDAKYSISVGNGTDALYIALKMLGIGPGDEVITTAHSWISTSETISQTGAHPVFVDTDEFFCINHEKIEEKITKRTKAIIPVHLYGGVCNMTEILKIAKKYKLFVLEDCAQAILSKWKDKNVGTLGDAGTLSFFPGKNLGAYGDAGGIITNKFSLFKKMKMFASHGGLKKHEHLMEGINSRMDSIQAAVLNIKIKKIKKWISKRRKIAKVYNSLLRDIEELEIPKERKGSTHSYHLYVVKTNKRNLFAKHLNEKGISTGIHYPKPLPLLPCYKYQNNTLTDYKNAISDSKKIISLPIYPELNEKQLNYICDQIKFFFKK